MIFDKQGTITIITQESVSIQTFIERFDKAYSKIKEDNIIINLFSLDDDITLDNVLEFYQISNNHKNNNKSFVIVTDSVSYDDLPDDLVIVPTFQEALDIIEMDEIERDLGI